MDFNLHTALTAIYKVIQDLPPDTGNPEELTRAENLILPNELNPDTSKKPYWRVSFLGTQPGVEADTNGGTFSFIVQIDIVVKSGSQIQVINNSTQLLWDCFPTGAEFEGARVSRKPDITDTGTDATNSGYRRVMTIPFRVSTYSKAN